MLLTDVYRTLVKNSLERLYQEHLSKIGERGEQHRKTQGPHAHLLFTFSAVREVRIPRIRIAAVENKKLINHASRPRVERT